MKILLSNLKIQLAWRYFLAWFWPVPLGAAVLGHLDAGIIIAAIIFFTGDWRNAPYKGPFTNSAGGRERWRSASFFIVLWLVLYLVVHFVLPHGRPVSLISFLWLLTTAITIIIINFTKPLPKEGSLRHPRSGSLT
jgi:hypothetical protein